MTDFYDLFRPKEPEPQPLAAVDSPGASSYAAAALRREADAVAQAPNGERNDTLNRYVVAPPSSTDAGRYRFLRPLEPTALRVAA